MKDKTKWLPPPQGRPEGKGIPGHGEDVQELGVERQWAGFRTSQQVLEAGSWGGGGLQLVKRPG